MIKEIAMGGGDVSRDVPPHVLRQLRQRFGTGVRGYKTIDIDYLIDRLEALVAAAKRVPLSNKVMVDDQELLDMIDQMRTVVPDEIRQAKRTLSERERILADAQREADRIVAAAHSEAEHLIGDRGLLAEAERQGGEIISEATREAEGIRDDARQVRADTYVQAQTMRDGANQYAMEVLGELDGLLSKHLTIVRKGLDSFQQAQQEQSQAQPVSVAPPPSSNANGTTPTRPAATAKQPTRPAAAAPTPAASGSSRPQRTFNLIGSNTNHARAKA